MKELIQIFLLNFITGIDNILIILAMIQRARLPQGYLALGSVILITINRTMLILGAQTFFSYPGLRLLSGMITLLIALRMAIFTQHRKTSSWLYILLAVVFTDATVSLDSILATAVLSKNLLLIAIGTFLSLGTLLFLLMTLIENVTHVTWIQIFVAGMIAQSSIQEMAKDQFLVQGTGVLQTFCSDMYQVRFVAIGVSMVIVSAGILKQIRGMSKF